VPVLRQKKGVTIWSFVREGVELPRLIVGEKGEGRSRGGGLGEGMRAPTRKLERFAFVGCSRMDVAEYVRRDL